MHRKILEELKSEGSNPGNLPNGVLGIIAEYAKDYACLIPNYDEKNDLAQLELAKQTPTFALAMAAAEKGYIKTLEYLLKEHPEYANKDSKDTSTLDDFWVEKPISMANTTILIESLRTQQRCATLLLLTEFKLNPNILDMVPSFSGLADSIDFNGSIYTHAALLLAIANEDFEVCELLIKCGANRDLPDFNLNTWDIFDEERPRHAANYPIEFAAKKEFKDKNQQQKIISLLFQGSTCFESLVPESKKLIQNLLPKPETPKKTF